VTPLSLHYYPCLYKTWRCILVDYVIAQSLYDLDDGKNVMAFFCYEKYFKKCDDILLSMNRKLLYIKILAQRILRHN
jgi:hypothetical protein